MNRFRAVRKKQPVFFEKRAGLLVFHNTYVDMFFREDLSGGEIFSLENESYFVKVSSPDLIGAAARFKERDRPRGDRNRVTLVADRFKNDSDLEYVIDRDRVKENIIVRSAQKDYSYDFIYDYSGLIPRVPPDGSCLEFINECAGRVQFRIPKPVMYDGTNTASDAVYYEIEMHSAYSFSLRVVADADWINSPERVFPVTIDPEIGIIGKFSEK